MVDFGGSYETYLLVRPLMAEVRQWVNANVDYQLIIEEDILIDHQHVDAVLTGLEEAGFQEGIDLR